MREAPAAHQQERHLVGERIGIEWAAQAMNYAGAEHQRQTARDEVKAKRALLPFCGVQLLRDLLQRVRYLHQPAARSVASFDRLGGEHVADQIVEYHTGAYRQNATPAVQSFSNVATSGAIELG